MSTPSPSPTKQARPTSVHAVLPPSASREKIRAESATGWSPLRIPNKPGRDSPAQPSASSHNDQDLSSPLAKHTTTTTTYSLTPPVEPEETYRRSSSSYKHLKTNSLVSNSPFKSNVDNTPPPPLPPLAKRSATAAKKAALGLGVPSSPSSSPRAPPTQRMQGGTTVGGGLNSSLLPRASPRRSSADRRKNEENVDPTLRGEPAVVVVVPGGTTDEDEGGRGEEPQAGGGGGGLSSGEEEAINPAALEKQRKAANFKKDAKRRQSAGLAGLSSKSKVSNSPFLTRSSSSEMEDSAAPVVAPPTPSPLVQSTSDDQLARDDDNDNEDDQSQSQYDGEEEEQEEAQEPQHPALFHPSPLESLSSTLSSSQPSSPSSSVLSAPSPPPPAAAQAAPSTPPRPHGHLLQNFPVSPSPGRSSLRSRRIRGPRDSAGSGGIAGSGSRPRRKTVTFQEGAEVSVFERAEGEDATTDSGDDDEYGVASDDDDENYGEEGSFGLDHQHRQQGGYSDEEDEQDSSYTRYPSREETQSATESFVSSLLEEDLFSPSSVTSSVFQSGMMGGMGIPPSPILVEEDPSSQTTSNDQPPQHQHQHQHSVLFPTPPPSELPHPAQNEHEIGMNEEVEVEEREGEVKVHQEGPLHDPFLPSTTPLKKMGGGLLGLGRPSGEVPRRRVADLEPEVEVEEEKEEEEEEGEVSMLDEGDSNVLEEMESMGLGEEEEEEDSMVMEMEQEEEGYSMLEEEGEEETSMVEEGNSFWEEEKTSEEVALVEGEVADHPLMGSRGLRLDVVEQAEVIERPSTPPPTFLAAPSGAADSPWKLPSLAASTSPLFNMKDLPETSPAVPQQSAFAATSTTTTLPPITTAQFQTSNSEQSLASSTAGEFGSYKPSSSLERLRAEDGEEGVGGSASGRSPRLTKESIRRRMDERKEREKVERERETSKGKQHQQSSSVSDPWRPIEGLGIAMPSTSPTKARPSSSRALSSTREEEHPQQRPTSRPSSPEKAHLNKELPAPPPRPTSQPMSRPKAATTDILPASIRTQSSSSDLERPALGGRSRSSTTLSARDLLASESALGRLALGAVATAAPSPSTRGTEVVRTNGSEKEVKLNKKSVDLERPSSSPIEEAPSFQLGGGHGRAPIPSKLLSSGENSSRREKERALMPPPPVPTTTSTKRSSSPTPSNASSTGGTREREEAIIAKRREKREEQGVGRPKGRGRRSLSTGDASIEGLQSAAAANSSKRRTLHEAGSRPQSTLDDVSIGANLTPFENDLTNEFDRITDHRNRQYKLNEREQVYIASDEKVSHNKKAGDLDRGKAWRSVKRPSDMNEYAEEIREIRAREKPGKSHAKVFVKIIGITDIDVPIPESTTTFQIVLNNGLHSVETQAYKFGKQVEIGQEFELLGLDNLEFSLAIKVRKDQHINSRLRSLTPRPGPAPSIIAPSLAPSTPTKTSAFRKLLSSPRKPKPATPSPVVARPVAPEPIKDDLVRYLASDGQLAIVKVIFKEISSKCNGQILNLHLPLTGRWNNDAVNSDAAARSPESAKKPRQIGRMQLQILMIDQIPGVPSDKLPQSLDDAVTGLRHVRWHKMDYFSGSLTQLGGDCSSWRRRQMRIVGGTLEATSDVTNKITARIDLSKMVEIRDDNDTTSTRDHDRTMSVERSFRLVFDDGEEIQFFADKDKDKEDWLHHLRELLGRVPSLPLWAELLWVRQHHEQSPAL